MLCIALVRSYKNSLQAAFKSVCNWFTISMPPSTAFINLRNNYYNTFLFLDFVHFFLQEYALCVCSTCHYLKQYFLLSIIKSNLACVYVFACRSQ